MLLQPFMRLVLLYRVRQGKEEKKRYKERLGYASLRRVGEKVVWLHAASVGETAALVPLINFLKAKSFTLLLTTGTVTAAAFAKNRFGNEIMHQYAPLDIKGVLERFLDHWRVSLSIVCESEVWPQRIMQLAERRIPQIWVNASLSERSYKNWLKRKNFAQFIYSKLTLVLCQEQRFAQYYYTLGAPDVRVSGNLKAETAAVVDEKVLQPYQQALAGRPVWAALSTHEGEELVAAKIHLELKKYLPNLCTIIVPRHPERCAQIQKELEPLGLKIHCRSNCALPDEEIDIFLGDSIGEMGFYLGLTPLAFMGKSLLSLEQGGGHNPLEAALAGVCVVSGPYVKNFQEIYTKLFTQEAALQVADATELALTVYKLLQDPVLCQKTQEKAKELIEEMSGALLITLEALQPFLQGVLMQAEIERGGEDYAF